MDDTGEAKVCLSVAGVGIVALAAGDGCVFGTEFSSCRILAKPSLSAGVEAASGDDKFSGRFCGTGASSCLD